MRSRISLRTRSAMRWSRSESSRAAMASTALVIERLHSSKMLMPPTVTARDSGLSRAPPQAGQATSRMYCSICSRDQSDSASPWRRLQPGHDPLVVGVVGAAAPEPVAVLHVDLLGPRAVEDELPVLGLGASPTGWSTENPPSSATAGHQAGEVLAAGPGPRGQGPVGQRERGVGHHQLGVDLEPGAQPGAGRAGAVGRVEGEVAGGRLLEAQPAVGAGQVLAEGDGLVLLGPPRPPSPPPRPCPRSGRSAVSIDSVSRWRMPSRRTRRSTTTSMVCCS